MGVEDDVDLAGCGDIDGDPQVTAREHAPTAGGALDGPHDRPEPDPEPGQLTPDLRIVGGGDARVAVQWEQINPASCAALVGIHAPMLTPLLRVT